MSVCNFVELITPETCIGDSLATFNKNFQALDEGLCNVPDIVPGTGIVVDPIEISEQMHGTVKVSTNNSFVYGTNFEYTVNAGLSNLPLLNGSTVSSTIFAAVTSITAAEPLGMFSTISLTHNLPKVTLFWTASGADTATVYATNSAISADTSLNFDGPITAMLSSGRFVYVGGDFITVAGKEVKKFCILDFNNGDSANQQGISLGKTATLVGSSLSANGGFGYNGEIRAIAEHENLLFFGGSYDSFLGRGFTAYDRTTGQIYPFYVNGEVNSVCVNYPYLYIGGSFDYINYGSTSSSKTLGTRVETNGLIKLKLQNLIEFPNNSLDAEYGANIKKQFNNLATINSIAKKDNTIYIGGNFQSFQNNELYAENIAIVNPDGFTSITWRPIVTGEVFKLFVTGDYLYLGGIIKAVHTYGEYTANPRKQQNFYNAACYLISVPPTPILQTNWTPMFNNAVTNFACQDGLGTPLYCYGAFTEVNENPANYLAAVEKSFENTIGGMDLWKAWRIEVEKSPKKINQCLFKSGKSLILGGNFTQINGKKRKYLARINGAYESLIDKPQALAVLGFGGQICGPGTNLNIDLTNYYTVSSYALDYGIVNQMIVPSSTMTKLFQNSSPGLLYKFFVNRPRNSGTLSNDVNIIGWKVDFN